MAKELQASLALAKVKVHESTITITLGRLGYPCECLKPKTNAEKTNVNLKLLRRLFYREKPKVEFWSNSGACNFCVALLFWQGANYRGV